MDSTVLHAISTDLAQKAQEYLAVHALDFVEWWVRFTMLFLQSTGSVGWRAACARMLCIFVCNLVYSRLATIRFRHALHYSVLYLASGIASGAFYMYICRSHADILCLAFVDCVFFNSVIAAYTYALVSIWIGVHDWSVGLPLRLEFVATITKTLKRMMYFAVAVRSCIYCASYTVASAHYIEAASCAHIIIMYSWLGLFVRRNARKLKDEFRVHAEIAVDDSMVSAVYVLLALLCTLHITDIGIEDKLAQVGLTAGVFATLLSVDAHIKQRIVQVWSALQDVEYNNNYSLVLGFVRAALVVCGMALAQAIWGVPQDFGRVLFQHWVTGVALRLMCVLLVAEALIILFGISIQRLVSHGKEFSAEGKKQRATTLFYFFRLVCGMIRFVACITVILTGFGVGLDKIVSYIGMSSALIAFVAKDACANALHGLFLVVEDAINIGDLVEIDQILGEVEGIGLTFIRVRSIDGALSFIQSGQIKYLKNRSRDFSYTLFNTAVTPDADIDALKLGMQEIFTEIQPLAAKEGILLGNIEYRGLVDVTFNRLVYQLRIKCSPGKQFIIKRMINDRMPSMMHKHGIKIPTGHALFMEKSSASNSEYRLY